MFEREIQGWGKRGVLLLIIRREIGIVWGEFIGFCGANGVSVVSEGREMQSERSE